ncbi:hypothetical protein Fot_06975 [Forsythia ovata]|uniref:Tropomyosin n=1 Tax=Forsythia ovata TaxID=205694 RepID=A0ABD1WUT1_9LAMI
MRKSDANVLALTKKLDDANAAQRISSEALGVANEEKKRLKEERDSYLLEVTCLKEEAKVFRTEFDRLKESLGASEKVGHQEVLAALRSEYRELDHRMKSLFEVVLLFKSSSEGEIASD